MASRRQSSQITLGTGLYTVRLIFPRVAVLQRRSNAFGRHISTKIMPRIHPMWFDGEMTGKHNSCREMRRSLQESEWKSNSKHVDDMTRLWRLKLESKETPTPVTKATGRRRDIDETLMQHEVRASREAAGTSSPAMGSSIQKETWLCRSQADPKTLHACRNTPWAAEDLTKAPVLSTVGKHSRRTCCDRKAIADHTDKRSEQWREREAPPE